MGFWFLLLEFQKLLQFISIGIPPKLTATKRTRELLAKVPKALKNAVVSGKVS